MKKFNALIFSIIGALLATNILTVCILSDKNEQLEKFTEEFGDVREGICVYSDCVYTGNKVNPYSCSICWVIDYETDRVIEVDVDDEILYCELEPGDTIYYIVDINHTDAYFLNVIKKS